jgi:hypothetical protein
MLPTKHSRHIISLSLSLLCVTSCGFELVNIEYDEKTFTKISNDILDHPEIQQMDDLSRYVKSFNYISINRQTHYEKLAPFVLDRMLDSLKIDKDAVRNIRDQLVVTKLRYYEKFGDSILFIVDGMLDTSWGFLFSKDGLSNDTSWFSLGGNSVKLTRIINERWGKVAVK